MSSTDHSLFEDRRTLPPAVAELLRTARAKAGLSTRQLARRAEVHPRYLRYLESGERCPSASVAADLARALRLDPGEAARLLEVAVPDHGRSFPKRRTEA